MGLFSKLFDSTTTDTSGFKPANEAEAWMAIVYACIKVDGFVDDEEVDEAFNMLYRKSLFENAHRSEMFIKMAKAHEKTGIGSQGMIEVSAGMVSPEYRPTLFALVMEILLSDGSMGEKEKEIAEFLCSKLTLDTALAEKIIEVSLIAAKGNRIY